MNKNKDGREDFEKLDYKAEKEHCEIIYINLIFVRIEFCFLCGQHYNEL